MTKFLESDEGVPPNMLRTLKPISYYVQNTDFVTH